MPEMNLQMRQMWTLVKREFQEYRTIFLYMPFGFALLVVFASGYGLYRMNAEGIALITTGQNPIATPVSGDQIIGLADTVFGRSLAVFTEIPLEMREIAVNGRLNTLTPGLFIAYWGSLYFYFILTLYQTRKDRSILFYNSMPVSDCQTVLSKLIAGMLALPLVYLAAMLLMQVLLLMLLSGIGLAAGMGSNIFAAFWQPAAPLANVLSVLLLLPLGALWTLPVYAALLLGSACARSAPFAWVAALPVAVITMEGIVYESTRTLALLLQQSIPYWIYGGPVARRLNDRVLDFMNLDMGLSILIGAAFVWLAIRFNRSEDS